MKRLLLITGLFCAALAGQAQETPAGPESLTMKETEFNFGKIPQGKPVFHSFDLVNAGKEPLVVANVQTSCGCTTPEWDKSPVTSGGHGAVKVGYNAAAEGPFEKFITITYNGSQTKIVKIKGEVWRAPSGPAPANASVDFLKQQLQ